MATMFNQLGIWSGRWEMFLDVKAIAAPNTPGPLTPKPRPTPIRAAVRSSPPAKRSRLPTSSAAQCTSKPGPSRTPPSYLSSKPGPSRATPPYVKSKPGPSRPPPAQHPVAAKAIASAQYHK